MAFVPNIPPRIIDSTQNSVRAAYQVLGNGTWQPTARAANYLLGAVKGSLVIAGGSATAISIGGSQAYNYYHWPRKQNPYQLWCVAIAKTGAGSASGTVEVPSGTSLGTWQIDDNVDAKQPQTFYFIRTIASPSGTASSIAVKVTNDSTSDVTVIATAICGYEMPRVVLDSFTAAKVVDDQTLASKAPIYEESSDELSINAVAVAAENAVDEARRSCLFSVCYDAGITITTGSFPGTNNVTLIDPSIVARHLYSGTNTYTVKVAVFAIMHGTTPSGDVKITAQSGGSVTLNFTSTSTTWVTGDLVVETEDLSRLSTDGGLRGGSRETLKIEARKTAGTDMVIFGICIGEP